MVSGGVRGLDHDEKHANSEALEILSSERDRDEALWENDYEDPITRAMRAADALYKETDSLQPIDCYIRTRPRSLSLPMLDYTDGLGQVSPFFVFGSSPSEEGGSVFGEDDFEASTTSGDDDSIGARNLKNSQGVPKLRISVPTRPASSIVETMTARSVVHRSTVQLLSSTVDSSMSPPTTPDGVVYGEARLVQMAAAKSQQRLRRVRSLDDMELNEARRRRISIQVAPATKRASPIDSPEAKSRHLSIAENPYSPNNFFHLPQAQFVKAQRTTIRRSPTFLDTLPKPVLNTYVHQGTDVPDFGIEDAHLEEEFEPVLPLHEDFVIHFTSFSRDYTLDSVIQSLKEGSYPVSNNTPDSIHTAETDSCPSTPRTTDLFELEGHIEGLSPVVEVPSAEEAPDYDPYAARDGDERWNSNLTLQSPELPPPDIQEPPTPSRTPTSHAEAKFYDFSTANGPNAIVTQNALRAVLEGYYPHEQVTGCSPSSSALLPGMDRLWRPIFRDTDAPGHAPVQSSADLILAIGSQKGVKSELVAALTGQVEKLGSKSNGMSRSGRLDIRYLIATAMQSSSTQPLTFSPTKALSDSPHALACLLIPHLDTYLATNSATRFLVLSYSAEHLATILCLQKLIGAGMLKVAGIIDTGDTVSSLHSYHASPSTISSSTDSSRAPSIASIERLLDTPSLETSPTPPLSISALAEHQKQSRSNLAHRRRVSFSRADYILVSSATESEIATLISTLWKVLISIDAFYTPEVNHSLTIAHPKSKTAAARAPPPPSLVSKFTFPNGAGGLTSPPISPPYSIDEVNTPRSLVALHFPYAPPSAPPPAPPRRDESPSRSSVRSGRSGRSGRYHIAGAAAAAAAAAASSAPPTPTTPNSRSLKRGKAVDGDAETAYAVNAVDDGDFYDSEERRLMPMYMRKNELRKGNSRKALKWLGLA
ncbi:unnamed protein product [Discula destructiva]